MIFYHCSKIIINGSAIRRPLFVTDTKSSYLMRFCFLFLLSCDSSNVFIIFAIIKEV
jgi:hypothetical protein